MLVLPTTLQLVQTHNLCGLLMKLAEVCLSVYRVLFFQITTQKIRHLELQCCTFFTLLLYKLHELILLYFLPSCHILDNQVILPGKCFLPPTCPGTSFVKNICRTLPVYTCKKQNSLYSCKMNIQCNLVTTSNTLQVAYETLLIRIVYTN